MDDDIFEPKWSTWYVGQRTKEAFVYGVVAGVVGVSLLYAVGFALLWR